LPIQSIAELAAALRSDRRFEGLEVARVAVDCVEVQRADASALLAMPSLWRDGDGVIGRLKRFSGAPALLVCLGSQEELAAASSLRKRAAYLCHPLPTTADYLAASLEAGLDMLAGKHRSELQGQLAERYRFELGEIIAIAAAINSERDINRLLGLILEKARYVTGADAGSIYVLVPHPERPEERLLRFEVAQNESVQVDFKAFTVEVSKRSIVGAAVLRREVINIPDLYALDSNNPLGLVHDRSFDKHTGYRTHSVLTVPLITQRDEVIGVLQLINKKTTPGQPLVSAEDFRDHVVAFDERSVELCKTLATQAAISLENALLYAELRAVFEGFVRASMQAIESRDPTTSGHSRRVAELTVGLAETVNQVQSGPLGGVRFGGDELKEIEYAGLLHDFGKIGVPEPVLLKAQKLYPWERELVVARFDYIRQWQRAEALRQSLDLTQRGGSAQQLKAVETALLKQEQYLGFCLEVVLKANQPSVLDEESAELLKEIAAQTYVDPRGERQPYLTRRELDCLGIRRGSLSEAERAQIESHVEHTFRFLCSVPWGRALKQIARIAADHHEKLDGTGYPARKKADEIPIQARMMSIADIFDALTASDRPYKKAVPYQRALEILQQEVNEGKLDPELFRLFVEAEVYRRVLET
jgi:HD-GYP domain-containing protein (c-di-GMP phosphodiesterase class II)